MAQVSPVCCFPRAGILFWTQGSCGHHVTHGKASPSLECSVPVCIELKNFKMKVPQAPKDGSFFALLACSNCLSFCYTLATSIEMNLCKCDLNLGTGPDRLHSVDSNRDFLLEPFL
jgi:hypothetical protein